MEKLGFPFHTVSHVQILFQEQNITQTLAPLFVVTLVESEYGTTAKELNRMFFLTFLKTGWMNPR